MLINKTENAVNIKYNGKILTIESGAKLDVRDFDTANKDVRSVEKHIINKNPGIFDVTNDKADVVTKEAMQELKDLKKAVGERDAKIAELQSAFDNLNAKHSASASEVSEAQKANASIKAEFDRISAANKDLEDEVEKLRLQLGTGKKNK